MIATYDVNHDLPQPKCSCGYVFRDAWEMDFGDGDDAYETECPRCDRSVSIVRHLNVTYTTTIK